MFHKLRLQLTLINAAVICLLFLVLTIGTYYYSHNEITRHSELLSKKIMASLENGVIHDFPPGRHLLPPNTEPPPDAEPPHGPNFFFIKVSPSGAIQFQSSNQPLATEDLEQLAAKALQTDSSQGVIALKNGEYPYLKSAGTNETETIILFQDFTREKNMLQIQLTALIVTGLTCLILSFLGSFFMANRAMAPIQTAWQQQKDFLSDASHELRTPLTVIQTNLDVVLDNQDQTVASQTKWLRNIQDEAAQMAKLVDSLLFLARADSRQPFLNKQAFSLNSVLQRSVDAFKATATAKGISLDFPTHSALTIYGDESRLGQVVSILIDNAIRHTESGGSISVALTQSANKAVIVVTDSGEGIDPKYLTKIFERFYQVDQARSNGGAGLGLAIAKSIIASHGGSIQVSSRPGAGTTFTIHLPLNITAI